MPGILSEQINIGKELESKLLRVDIDSYEKLKSLGSQNAFLRLQTVDSEACINMLFALEGAIEGIRWHDLSAAKKQELKEFFRMTKKS